MLPRFEVWLETDMAALPNVVALPDDTFTADAQANKVGVRVYKGEAPVEISGTIKGYIITPDNRTITVNGSKNNNEAYVILPASAYTTPGKIAVYIKCVDGDSTTTIGACQCMMHRAVTEVNV